jgi:hypothetical protein
MVEDDIVKHYRSEDGIWLVEKGKIKEAKMLKEAYERIHFLRKEYSYYYKRYKEGIDSATLPYKQENADLRKDLEKQKAINKQLLAKYSSIRNAVTEIELLGEKVDV